MNKFALSALSWAVCLTCLPAAASVTVNATIINKSGCDLKIVRLPDCGKYPCSSESIYFNGTPLGQDKDLKFLHILDQKINIHYHTHWDPPLFNFQIVAKCPAKGGAENSFYSTTVGFHCEANVGGHCGLYPEPFSGSAPMTWSYDQSSVNQLILKKNVW